MCITIFICAYIHNTLCITSQKLDHIGSDLMFLKDLLGVQHYGHACGQGMKYVPKLLLQQSVTYIDTNILI